MAKLPLSPAGEIHILGTRPWCRKAHKALRGGCRLGTAIGALQGSFAIDNLALPRFSVVDLPRVRYSHARIHAHNGRGAVLSHKAPRMAKGGVWSVAKA